MEDKISNLIQKAKKLENNSKAMSIQEIKSIKSALGIIFSKEFLEISTKFHFEYLESFDWDGISTGAIKYTQRLRKEGLPHKYMVLASQGSAGTVFLETQDSPEKPSPVIWCNEIDVYNLCKNKEFEYNSTIWPTFADFFEYLVDREERERAEEAQENAHSEEAND